MATVARAIRHGSSKSHRVACVRVCARVRVRMTDNGVGHAALIGLGFALASWITGTVFAWLEIEIEGPFAWSRDNPHTWRRQVCGFGICLNGLPLTGYHLTMFTTVLLFAYGTYATQLLLNGNSTNWADVLATANFYVFVVLLEDAQWYRYNSEYKRLRESVDYAGMIRDPFGGTCNRIARYVLNFLIFVALWFVQFAARSHDAALFAPLSDPSDSGQRVGFGAAILGWLVLFTVALLVVERFTLIPAYSAVRAYLVKDASTQAMNYAIEFDANAEPSSQVKLSYYVVPDRDNTKSLLLGGTEPARASGYTSLATQTRRTPNPTRSRMGFPTLAFGR